MPNEPLFEAMELSPPFNIKMVTMKDAAEQYYRMVKLAMDILERGGCVCYEHTTDEKLYYIQKRGRDRFGFTHSGKINDVMEISAEKVLNILFAHVPFMPMVGEERGVNLK